MCVYGGDVGGGRRLGGRGAVPAVSQALALPFFFLIHTSTHDIGSNLPISWVRKIWHREVNELAQSGTAALDFKPSANWL